LRLYLTLDEQDPFCQSLGMEYLFKGRLFEKPCQKIVPLAPYCHLANRKGLVGAAAARPFPSVTVGIDATVTGPRLMHSSMS
jgi:hypothetical protein